MDLRYSLMRSTISSAVSNTVSFWLFVSVMTVSGVLSICSIKSQFNTMQLWFKRVTWIIALSSHSLTSTKSLGIRDNLSTSSAAAEFSLEFMRIQSEKRVSMPSFEAFPAVPAAVLAQRVLDVWITNDDASLETELKRVLYRTRPATMELIEVTGVESERQELIRAIALSMDRGRKTRGEAAQEPRCAVWIDLLRHLSVGESASPASAPN